MHANEYFRAEIERLKKLLEARDLELFNVQQSNQQLLKKYGAEISYLLNAQKESQVSSIYYHVLDVASLIIRF